MARVDRGALFKLGGIFAAVWLLWSTPVVYPLKVLVVLLHEISHGIAAVATGGSIDRIVVSADEGGVCWTSGGVRFITLSAGYLGSMLWGSMILIVASRTRFDRLLCGALGMFLLLVTLRFVQNGFGQGFGVAAGAVLVLAAWRLPEAVSDLTLKTIGLTSCLYAILDIKSDILDRPGAASDAGMLHDLTHIPTIVWGVLWILAALGVAAVTLLVAAPGEGEPSSRIEAKPHGSPLAAPGGARASLDDAAALIDELARGLPPRVKP